MGDDGRMYVAEDVLPAYKGLLRDADLILPNQYEAEYGLTLAIFLCQKTFATDPISLDYYPMSTSQTSRL